MNFTIKRPKSHSSLAELKRKSAENLQKLESKAEKGNEEPTNPCRFPDRKRCNEILIAIEAPKRVSRPEVFRAVGSKLESELDCRLEENEYLKRLEKEASRALRNYEKLRTEYNLMLGRMKSARLSPSNAKKLETMHSRAMEVLESALSDNPELQCCISVPVADIYTTDPEQWPYRVYPSQGPQKIMGQFLRMAIEGKSTV